MELDHRRKVPLDQIMRVALGEKVTLSGETAAMLAQRREQVVAAVTSSHIPAYGFNRGFGHRADLSVPPNKLEELQLNLIRSHACGSGPNAPRLVVRATMFLRALSLSLGFSGVRPQVVEQLLSFLNHDIVPDVPVYGSVGASGDLAPLSHVALALIGEGDVTFKGRSCSTRAVLGECGLTPLSLQMKEGLALSNGVQFSNAMGIVALDEMWALLQTAVVASALGVQVFLASEDPYDPDLQCLRPHPGALEIARWMRELCANAPIQRVHSDVAIDGEVQDPYSLRCIPQVLGTVHDLLSEAGQTFLIEANSATDNPLVLPEDGKFTRIVSGGHFHGMPVAVKLYNLLQGMAIIARLSNMRCARYVDGRRNRGLGDDLVWPGLDTDSAKTSSGYMVPEYLSAALLNAVWSAAMPSHLFSVATDAGQEDIVSMSATLGWRVLETMPRLHELLAVELAFAAQAAAIRKVSSSFPSKCIPADISIPTPQTSGAHRVNFEPRASFEVPLEGRSLSPRCEAVLETVRATGCILERDRSLSSPLRDLTALVRNRTLISRAGQFW